MDNEELRRRQLKKKKAMNRRKLAFYRFLTKVTAAIMILFLLLNIFHKTRETSDTENRALAQKPKFSISNVMSGEYFKNLDSYVSDQFVGRDTWMSMKAFSDRITLKKEAGGVYLGSKGYLISKPVEPDNASVASTTDAINDFYKKHSDLRFSMIVVPGAATVMKNKLPAFAKARNQDTDILGFEAGIDPNINKVDATTILKNASTSQVYYKTDHHWTSMGAYEVFNGSLDALGITEPVKGYNVHTVTKEFQGTLASKSGQHTEQDSIQVYEPQGTDVQYYVTYPDTGKKSASMFVSDKLKEKDKYQVFFGGNHPLVDITTTADNGRVLLVFKDSYANSFIQFLYPYYQKIILIDPRYYYEDIEAVMTSYAVTDVLFLYSSDTLLVDKGISDTLSGSQDAAANVTTPAPVASPSNATPLDASPADSDKQPE